MWQQICYVVVLVDSANVCIKNSNYSLRAGKQNRSSWLSISTYGKPEKCAQRYDKLCPVQKLKQDEKLLERMERTSCPLRSQLSGERDILLHCKRRGWKLIEETILCCICLAFRSLTRALNGIKVVLLETGDQLLSQSIP